MIAAQPSGKTGIDLDIDLATRPQFRQMSRSNQRQSSLRGTGLAGATFHLHNSVRINTCVNCPIQLLFYLTGWFKQTNDCESCEKRSTMSTVRHVRPCCFFFCFFCLWIFYSGNCFLLYLLSFIFSLSLALFHVADTRVYFVYLFGVFERINLVCSHVNGSDSHR